MLLIAMITHVNYYIRQMLAVCRCRCQRRQRQRQRHRHRVGTWRKPQSGQPTKTEATKCNWFCCIISTAFSAFSVCRQLHSIYWRCAVLYCCQQSEEWGKGWERGGGMPHSLRCPRHETQATSSEASSSSKGELLNELTTTMRHRGTHTHTHTQACAVKFLMGFANERLKTRTLFVTLNSNGGKINL